MSAAWNDPVGQFFLTFDGEGNVEFRGQILNRLEPGSYLCQLFSAFTDEPTCQVIKSVSQMAKWQFYTDIGQWQVDYANARGGRRV